MLSDTYYKLKFNRFHILIIMISSIIAMSCFPNDAYDQTKKHHTEDGFNSTIKETFFSWIKMRFNEGAFPVVKLSEAESIVTDADKVLISSTSDRPRATWIGHATVLVQYRGINYLTDPHLTDIAAPIDILGTKRLTAPALNRKEIPDIDFIVISHNHYDHLDLDTVAMFANSVTWYVPLGLKTWFEDQGIHSDKVIELDWWQSHQFNKEVIVTFTPSIHWSKRSLFDTNESLWGSWSITIDGFKTWFGGDTGYDENVFKEIGKRTGPYDLSLIPIGAYAPRYFMKGQHVSPAQAVQIHIDIDSKHSMPIHWGTFQLTKEPFLEPPVLLHEALDLKKVSRDKFMELKIGETIIVDLN